MNICLQSTKTTTNRTLVSSLLLASCVIASTNIASASQNSVLAEIELAPADWKDTNLQLTVNDSVAGTSVNLGDTVSINLTGATPANVLLVLVNTYGDVKIIKPDTADNAAAHNFEASAPVGQYSLFAFGSESKIQENDLSAPIGQYIFQASDAEQAVKSVIDVLQSGGSKVSMSPEYQFSIDDGALANNTRGLEKKVRKMRPKPTVQTTSTPSTSQPVAVETIEPVAVTAIEPVTIAAIEPLAEVPKAEEAPRPQVEFTQVVESSSSAMTLSETPVDNDSLALDIKFQINSGDLTQSGINQLDSLGSVLVALQRENAMPSIMLEGHTDNSGTAEYNQWLSTTRANAAREYLINRFDLPASNIAATGLGESMPKTQNTSPEGRRANRRVELKLAQ